MATDTVLPPIAAVFLVVFDRKVGYTIAWKRAVPGLELDGVVEFKCLPSGLHNVQSDLVYFVHEQYAGVSAFANHPAEEVERNASFATVGVLVPLTYGRLGRSWLHANRLRELAEVVVSDTNDTAALEEYWDQHCISSSEGKGKARESSSSAQNWSNQNSRRKRRTLSDATGFGEEHTLSKDHPAMSLVQDFETFGPLLFPLHRAALLKKKILILTGAPVQPACNFVYNLSVLSNIPPSVADMAHTSDSLHPVRPLFSVGIHDIDHLSNSTSDTQSSWLACSTDDILATKTNLYDLLVELAPPSSAKSGTKQWPRIRTPDGQAIKATQRDLRRYYTLKRELNKRQRQQKVFPDEDDEDDEQAGDDDDDDDDVSESAPLTRAKSSDPYEQDDYVSLEGEASLAEASSWASIAYSSFLWWASAGEKDALLEDEALQDSRLLDDLPSPNSSSAIDSRPSSRSGGKRASTGGRSDGPDEESQSVAVSLIAYAHRLTTLIMEALAEIVEAAEDGSEDGDDQNPIAIQNEELRRMGLDEWSQADSDFVKDMVALYFGRECDVQMRSVECCGVKIL